MLLDPITLAFLGAAVVLIVAVVVWLLVARRRVTQAAMAIERTRAVLEAARRERDTAAASQVVHPAERASLDDEAQAARRAANAAVREGESLRRRFPASLFAGRIPEARYEESEGGAAEPPRIAF